MLMCPVVTVVGFDYNYCICWYCFVLCCLLAFEVLPDDCLTVFITVCGLYWIFGGIRWLIPTVFLVVLIMRELCFMCVSVCGIYLLDGVSYVWWLYVLGLLYMCIVVASPCVIVLLMWLLLWLLHVIRMLNGADWGCVRVFVMRAWSGCVCSVFIMLIVCVDVMLVWGGCAYWWDLDGVCWFGVVSLFFSWSWLCVLCCVSGVVWRCLLLCFWYCVDCWLFVVGVCVMLLI